MKNILTISLSLFFVPLILNAEFDHQHQELDTILAAHVRVVGNTSAVDYQGLKDKSYLSLKKYNASLSTVSKDDYEIWSSEQQLAFLINAYNSFTLEIITSNYPLKSAKDLKLAGLEVWDYKFIKLLDQQISLNQLENSLIRENFNEPRIHFLLNCAAVSCPVLQPKAISSENLESILDFSTKNFLTDIKRNSFDQESNKLSLSQIFNWYESDFKKSTSLKSFLNKYLSGINEDTTIQFNEYDWSLNKLN